MNISTEQMANVIKEDNKTTKEISNQPEADPLSKRSCLHSRKLLGWADNSVKNISFRYLEQHVQECSYCAQHSLKILKLKNEIEKNIPSQTPDQTAINSMNNEIKEMLSRLSIERKQVIKTNKTGFFFKRLLNLISAVIKY